MLKIGKTGSIEDYEEQIDYCDEILEALENLQILYGKNSFFNDEYKEIGEDMKYIEDVQNDLRNDMEECINKSCKEYDEEMRIMNAEYERSQF